MKNTNKDGFKVNEAASQFELHVDGHVAFIEYYREGEKLFLTHTEAPEALRGKGAASRLVQMTLQCAKDNGFTVMPLCSYVAKYVNDHPEWSDILSEGYRM
jgi:predicted GNAT family acetyltransferase